MSKVETLKYAVQSFPFAVKTTTTTICEQATARCFDMKRSSEAAGVEIDVPHHYNY